MNELFGRRVGAYLVDNLVLSVIASFPISVFLKIPERGMFALLVSLFLSASSVIYWTLCDLLSGQSLGKMIFGIRTVSTLASGNLNPLQALGRNLTKAALPFLMLDSLPVIIGKERQRYTEKLTRTRTVEWR
ncbi:MAG: RDD family protein [archaeon]